jgi:serine protease Do
MKEGLQMNHEFDFDNRELEDSQNIPETLPAEENDLAGTPEEPPEGTDTVLEPVTTQTEDTHTPAPDTSEEQPEPSVCQPAYSQHKGKRAKEKKKRKKSRWVSEHLMGVVCGILAGLLIGMVGRSWVQNNGTLSTFFGQMFSFGDEEYEYDKSFEQQWDENVEQTGETEETYTLPAYQGDSSGLTIALNDPADSAELTTVELYQQDLPATVSLTVYAGTSAAYGSGIVLTENGFILTCAHVVDNTSAAVVTTSDGQQYEATLVGSDAQTDLAVLKIEASGLTAAEFADSDKLVIGERVCAIGDPLGPQFRSSLTDGIISGLNRQISSNGYAMTLIQTSAAVNSGNSGGALFNSHGQVIGVVNMKMSGSSSTASIDNMGLAVPSTTVKEVVEALAANGSISRAVLGISCVSIDATASRVYGIPQGLWVMSVDENSDCATQGVLLQDIITHVNGQEIDTVADFKAITADCQVGDTVTLTIWREPESEKDTADTSADPESSASAQIESYHYELYGDITVALMDSANLTN